MTWVAEHTAYEPPNFFSDKMVKGPFKSWKHDHHLVESEGLTTVVDEVAYQVPFGPLGNLVDRFLFDSIRRSLKPKVLIDYIRRPYVSSYDMNFRVTFDSVLMSAATNELFPPQWTNWKHSRSGFTVLEVKFFRRIPAWFHRIIQAHNLKRISFSKFCQGMETTGLAVDLS